MQDLKIYICIEDPKTKQDVSIKGNFEILLAFLSGVGTLDIQADPALVTALPVEDAKPEQGGINVHN